MFIRKMIFSNHIYNLIILGLIFLLNTQCTPKKKGRLGGSSAPQSNNTSVTSIEMPTGILLANETPSVAYGSSSTPSFTISTNDASDFLTDDTITLYRDGTNSCDGLSVDSATLGSNINNVILGDSLTTNYGDHNYFVKLTRGADSICSAVAGTYHLLRTLSVVPRYTNGSNWNDWTKSDDSAPCAGTESNISDCIHGGDKRMVWTSYKSCSGLSMSGNLGAFDWTCEIDGISGFARFVSTLKSNKRLSDLINGTTAWADNYVTLSGGLTPQTSTTSNTWWTNTVTALPTNAGTTTPVELNSSGTIYVLASNANSVGFYISADKVSIAMPSTATLSNNQRGTFSPTTAVPSTSGSAVSAIIAASNVKHLWIEGKFVGSGNKETGIFLYTVKFSNLRQVTVQSISASSGTAAVIDTIDNDCNPIAGTPAGSGYDSAGIWLRSSSKNYFNNITVSNISGGSGGSSASGGLYSCYIDPDTLYYEMGSSPGGDAGKSRGVYLENSDKNVFNTMSISSINGNSGGSEVFTSYSGSSLCVDDINAAGNPSSAYGFYISNSTYNTLNTTTINGITAGSPVDGYYSYIAGREAYGIYSTSAANNTYSTLTITNINASNGTNSPGSVSTPCLWSNYNLGPGIGANAFGFFLETSTTTTVSNLSMTNIFAGSAGSNGSFNTSYGNTSASNGADAFGIYAQNISGSIFTTISLNSIYAGSSQGGFDNLINDSNHYGVPGNSSYGIFASTSGTYTVNNITTNTLTATSAAGGNDGSDQYGGSAYGIYTSSGTVNVNTGSFNNHYGGSAVNLSYGGSVYGVYSSSKSTSGLSKSGFSPGTGYPDGDDFIEN